MALILILTFLAAPPAMGAPPPGTSSLASADAAYAKRENLQEAARALAGYEQSIRENPKEIEAYWKGARAAWWLGDHAEPRSEKLKYFEQGIHDAQEGIAQDPSSVDAHFWLGCSQ